MKPPKVRRNAAERGFALVISLSLMVLLTLLAVGLLALSSIELRSTGNSSAKAEARANARLALMLAIGDLQKHAGPDTRITATAATLDEDAPQPMLAGVWNSRKLNPNSPDNESRQTDDAKSADFRKWLVSNKEPAATDQQDFSKGGPGAEAVVLVSKETVEDAKKEIRADRVKTGTLPSGEASGAFAYAVLDDGVKARVNLGRETRSDTLASRTMTLGNGQMPGLDRLEGITLASLDSLDLSSEEGRSHLSKMVSIAGSELGHGTERGNFGKYFHDLTAHSAGLMTRVSTGGLKEDLNLLAEASPVPTEYAGKKFYQLAYGLNLPSDPGWPQALSYANVYQGKDSRSRPLLSSTNGVPTLRAAAPANWNAGTGVQNGPAVPTKTPPSGAILMPAVAKVQMAFSLLARDVYNYPKGTFPSETAAELHGPWGNNFRNSSYDYLLHLLYTPVITLHNPYNVAIEFTNLKLEFVNLPFALQIFRNGQAQSSAMVPIGRMYSPTQNGGQAKRFGITLSNKAANGSPIATPVRMLPGEVKIFSPYIPPTLSWATEASTQAYFFDWRNENESDGRDTGSYVDTSQIKATPGWRGDGIGYDLDWFAPTGFTVSTVEKENGKQFERGSCIALRRQDEIHVEFAPLPDPTVPEKRFTVEMTLIGANANTRARTSVIDFNYETSDGLQKTLLGAGGKLRYPEDGTINTMKMHDHSSTALKDYVNPKPFALFSAYAKTTHGGFDPSSDDGSYPAKPWVYHNHTGVVSSQKVVTEHPAHHAHEINLVRLPGHTDEVIDIQPGTDRGNFVTGHTVFNGRRFGTLFDVPLGPMQSLVSLNFANLGTSYYLPRFTAPVGNSFAHPLMSTSAITEGGIGGTYADHSYLLNSILFDGYYCSGFQSRGGALGDGATSSTIAREFLDSEKRLPDTRFLPYMANGETPEKALEKITATDGYRRAAAYQILQGAFNVNSTSIDAWKTMLSSMNGADGAVNEIPETGSTGTAESITNLKDLSDEKGARFSRFRLPNKQAESGEPNAYWHGPRELTEQELNSLATEIVKQVRERGPFLSMGEFVNRQLGSANPNTLAGALQVAIDEAGINSDADIAGYSIDSGRLTNLELKTPAALTGSSAQGAPGYLTQADILGLLGNAATVRSDTFTIRAYGESLGAKGEVQARAWCEAVVQRMPEFLDTKDEVETRIDALASEANKTFGRRFVIQSFRWLGSGEI